MIETAMSRRLNEEIKSAMKSGDKDRLETLRLLKASLQKVLIDKGASATSDDEIAFLAVEVKRRKEAAELYLKGGRKDLADKEERELVIISEYLPKPLTEEELRTLVDEAVRETGAQSPKDMGRVMSAVMPKVKGKADGKTVQELVKARLGN
jgi:hypothetical protein